MARVKVDGYRCERCKHVWVPRLQDKTANLPKVQIGVLGSTG